MKEHFEYVMPLLLNCDNDDIALLQKLRWRNLQLIHNVSGPGNFSDLPKESLGHSIIFLHKYMIAMNVCDELATMNVDDWNRVDYFLIDMMYRNQIGVTPTPCHNKRHPTQTPPTRAQVSMSQNISPTMAQVSTSRRIPPMMAQISISQQKIPVMAQITTKQHQHLHR